MNASNSACEGSPCIESIAREEENSSDEGRRTRFSSDNSLSHEDMSNKEREKRADRGATEQEGKRGEEEAAKNESREGRKVRDAVHQLRVKRRRVRSITKEDHRDRRINYLFFERLQGIYCNQLLLRYKLTFSRISASVR